jgi:hypothetical protein
MSQDTCEQLPRWRARRSISGKRAVQHPPDGGPNEAYAAAFREFWQGQYLETRAAVSIAPLAGHNPNWWT